MKRIRDLLNELINGKGLTVRRIDAIAGALCVLAALPFCFARVNPMLRPKSYIAEQKARLESLRKSHAELAAAASRRENRLIQTRRALSREKIQLQSAGSVNRRLAKLTDLAESTGLKVDEILPGESTRTGPYETVPVELRASGAYPTCVRFLRKLKETFPDTAVGSFELAGTPQQPGEPAEFHVDLLWYTTATPAED